MPVDACTPRYNEYGGYVPRSPDGVNTLTDLFSLAMRNMRKYGRRTLMRLNFKEFKEEEPDMLWTIFVVLLVLWLLGLVSSYTLGGFIHILLVLALVVLVINLVSGRRTAI
jgi:hypothetical protein